MHRITFAVFALLLQAAAVRADCQADVATAMRRANELPPTAGRAALLEQIQRAEVAQHEGDDGECADQLADATKVLDEIDAAKKREDDAKKSAASGKDEPAKGDAAKP